MAPRGAAPARPDLRASRLAVGPFKLGSSNCLLKNSEHEAQPGILPRLRLGWSGSGSGPGAGGPPQWGGRPSVQHHQQQMAETDRTMDQAPSGIRRPLSGRRGQPEPARVNRQASRAESVGRVPVRGT